MDLYIINACVLDMFGLYGALSSPAPSDVTLETIHSPQGRKHARSRLPSPIPLENRPPS